MARLFTERLKTHNENPNTHYMLGHEALSLGMHISEEDKMIFACTSTLYMLWHLHMQLRLSCGSMGTA